MSDTNQIIANVSHERLSLKEKQMIEMIRNEKFQSLKIIKKNGRTDMIEGVERVEERQRIVDILREHNYQNIEIKQSDGHIVHISRTVKIKVK